jgi:hypothetical protein
VSRKIHKLDRLINLFCRFSENRAGRHPWALGYPRAGRFSGVRGWAFSLKKRRYPSRACSCPFLIVILSDAADQIFINYGKTCAVTGLNVYSYTFTKQLLTACTTTPCSTDILNTVNEEMISIKLNFDATCISKAEPQTFKEDCIRSNLPNTASSASVSLMTMMIYKATSPINNNIPLLIVLILISQERAFKSIFRWIQ